MTRFTLWVWVVGSVVGAAGTVAAQPVGGQGRCARVGVWRDGRMTSACSDDAEDHGLTVVDLADDWTPGVFSEAPEFGAAGRQPYRSTFLALADERYDRGAEFDRAREDR